MRTLKGYYLFGNDVWIGCRDTIFLPYHKRTGAIVVPEEVLICNKDVHLIPFHLNLSENVSINYFSVLDGEGKIAHNLCGNPIQATSIQFK